jgi:hypothetical protein
LRDGHTVLRPRPQNQNAGLEMAERTLPQARRHAAHDALDRRQLFQVRVFGHASARARQRQQAAEFFVVKTPLLIA